MKRLFLLLPFTLLAACSSDTQQYDASGVFESTEVVVSAQTAGELSQMNFSEGDTVAAGQQLALVDTIQLSLQRRRLLANLTTVGACRYDVSRQVAAIRQQIATQQKERRRFAQLVSENAANQKTVDDIDAQILLLERQLAAQTETLENTNTGVSGETEALVAQIAQIDDQLRRARVLAPIDGTVLAKYAEQGELAASGRQLYKLADMRHLYLRAYVTAPQLTHLRLGQKVRVFADDGESGRRAYEGRITWIADEAEFTPKTIQTRDERANLVYAIKVAVENDGGIKLGMYGECQFQ